MSDLGLRSTVSGSDVADISLGGSLLASGGGGDVSIGRMLAKHVLRMHGSVPLLPLRDLDDDATVIAVGGVGAPSIMAEKVSDGNEAVTALRTLEAHLGRRADALIAFEAGGFNSLVPIMVGAKLKLPVVDADGMGRAFPAMQMETFSIYGVSATPLALAGNPGNSILMNMADTTRAERLIRHFTIIGGGGVSYSAEHVMDGATTKRVAVPGTISLSGRLGRSLKEHAGDIAGCVTSLQSVLAQASYGAVQVLFTGKVSDVDRQVKGGYDVGLATIQSFADANDTLTIDIQNEYLSAKRGDCVLATVPDLVCVLDNQTLQPITQENLRYGQRVTVIGIGAPRILCTERALCVVGPRAFGMDCDYLSLPERLRLSPWTWSNPARPASPNR